MDDLLREQIAYYRARAPGYDDWWERRGVFDLGPDWNARWSAELDEVGRAVDEFGLSGDVLEIAAGTGLWTRRLARPGVRVAALDSSPEALDRNRERVRGRDIRFVVADVFAWEPDAAYDAVFFSHWLAHVPPGAFEAFWDLVGRALRPGGRVFFVDSLSRRHPELQAYLSRFRRDFQPQERPDGSVVRRLDDGREFRIVNVLREPDDVRSRLRELGWDVDLGETEWFFYWAQGTRADG